MYIYYPSCNFATMHLQTAKKVRDYFEKQMPIARCCKIDKREFEKIYWYNRIDALYLNDKMMRKLAVLVK